ncbi:hypothetical protein Ddc_01531 [Ditylenchus destructor]|nr:hypothetical protein Ddc_01531 [Ditylenchus destructor]
MWMWRRRRHRFIFRLATNASPSSLLLLLCHIVFNTFAITPTDAFLNGFGNCCCGGCCCPCCPNFCCLALAPPGVPPLSALFCAPPACGCGCCCAPPVLCAPPVQPARAPIVPVPRILQPPQPAQPRKQICAIPVAQCLLPCRAPPCPRNNQCCCDCCCDDDYDDYKKRRKRRKKRSGETNSLRYPFWDTGTNREQMQSCMRLLNRRKTQCNQDVSTMSMCKPQCTSEQISRCKSKRLLLEMICAKVKSKLSHNS